VGCAVNITKYLVFALCTSVSVVAGAQGLVLSCSAKAVYGRSNDLSVYEREGHRPSIVIDLTAQTIVYEYSRDGQTFQFIYHIQETVDGVLWAVEPSQTGRKNHLSFDMNSLKFSTSHLNGGFNTLKFGSCSKTI